MGWSISNLIFLKKRSNPTWIFQCCGWQGSNVFAKKIPDVWASQILQSLKQVTINPNLLNIWKEIVLNFLLSAILIAVTPSKPDSDKSCNTACWICSTFALDRSCIGFFLGLMEFFDI